MRMLFSNAVVYGKDAVLDKGFLAVRDGVIESVGAERPAGEFDVEKDMSGRLLMPGLVNAHTHIAMTLLRGVGTDLPLREWLFDTVFPIEARLNGEMVAAGSALAMLEMIACGTTAFTDSYFFPEGTAALVEKSGMKAVLTYPLMAFAPDLTWEKNENARKLERFHSEWNGRANGRVIIGANIHAEYTCNESNARGVAAWAKDKGAIMQMHLSETKSEHENCIKKYGKTPTAWMESIGLFDVPSTAAHCVWVTDEDRAIMREKKVFPAHNPTSNLKLGSGLAPIAEMHREGLCVTIGTDGAASNNNLNMFEELHLAALLQKGRLNDPAVMRAAEVVTMATENGALSQGRADTGTLAPGKRADIIALDLTRPHHYPIMDAAAQIAYCAQGSDVCMTMVDGEILYENGEYKTLDAEKIIADAKQAVAALYRK